LRKRLDRGKTADHLESERLKNLADRDFDHHVETGFQIATFQGPLCAEPVEGIAYFLESLEIDRTNAEQEGGANFFDICNSGDW
jgi:ribosome assembly protein 1